MFMFIVPTYSCNLKCAYCFEANDRNNHSLPLRIMDVYSEKVAEDLRKYLMFLKSTKTGYPQNIKFHGGEATLLPAKDILYLAKVWRDMANEIFGEDHKTVYINMVTNGVNIVTNPEYREELFSDPEVIVTMAISYDLFSQPVRSPNISLAQYEEFFKWYNGRMKHRIGILAQISYHSLEHREEWLAYFRKFQEEFSPYIENIRLRFVSEMKFDSTNTNLNSDDKLYDLLLEARKIENALSLEGKGIPTSYYSHYLNFDDSKCFATCSITVNSCWGNMSDALSMCSYNGETFTLGCAGATADPEYNFTDFDQSLKKALRNYDTNLTNKRTKQCMGCEFKNRCMPCNFEVNEPDSIYNGVTCKKQYKAIERINRRIRK